MSTSEDEIQPLSCWPPPSPEEHNRQRTEPGHKNEDNLNGNNSSECNKMNDTAREVGSPSLKRFKRTETLESCDTDEEDSDDVAMADVAVARWWRTNQKAVHARGQIPCGATAHTLLVHVMRLPEAVAFMRSEVVRLESCVCRGNGSVTVHRALGTLYERLGEHTKAFHHLTTAISMDHQDKEAAWILERVVRQLRVSAAQSAALCHLKNKPRCLPHPCKVARRSAASLSYTEFLHRYAVPRVPVVITGLGQVITSQPWTLDHLRQIAGSCRAPTRRLVQGSVEWARLEPGPELTVAEVVSRIQHPDPDTDPVYLFDWSLPLHCPQLAQQVTIPKYFAGDVLQRTSDGTLYRDSWPSLFVAPAGLRSELHVDAFGSNFWMALLSGTKRWVFFPPEDTPLLYPRYWHSLDPVFDVDLANPNLDLHPLTTLARPQEVVLQEGEVLFVPAGCAHRVENLTDTVAISANFVDLSNLSAVKAELSSQALVDPRADELLRQLDQHDFDFSVDADQEHLPLHRFKTRGKSGREESGAT